MYKNSVAILGKGSSINKCKTSFVDKFSTIVGCGKPVFKGYEHLIGDRMHYDYSNSTATDYSYLEKDRLGIRMSIDTGSGTKIREDFKYKDLDPSTGILAFHDFVTNSEYQEIALLGFDLFQQHQ